MGTTSQKLTYLNETKTKIKDAINLGGANITTDTFRAYEGKLIGVYKDIFANGIDTLWNNWDNTTATGETLNVSNTIKAPIKYTLKGNTSQNGTPTPSSPVSVNVVSGDNSINVCGKNLFNLDWVGYRTTNGITATRGEDYILLNGTATATAYINFSFPSNITNYIDTNTHTWFFSSTQVIDRIQIQRDSGGNINVDNIQDTKNTSFGNKLTGGYIQIGNGKTLNNCKVYIDTRVGTQSATSYEYEPYTSQNYNISLGTNELCKIGTYQDYIYKDNGNWYLHKEIGKVVLDGGDEITITDNGTSGTLHEYRIEPTPDKVIGRFDLVSNYFTNTTSNVERILGSDSSKRIFFRITDTTASSVANFKTWLSTHNTTVYYVLATATNTQITDTNLISQLEKVKSENGTTNVSQVNNDKPFIIDATILTELE